MRPKNPNTKSLQSHTRCIPASLAHCLREIATQTIPIPSWLFQIKYQCISTMRLAHVHPVHRCPSPLHSYFLPVAHFMRFHHSIILSSRYPTVPLIKVQMYRTHYVYIRIDGLLGGLGRRLEQRTDVHVEACNGKMLRFTNTLLVSHALARLKN